MPGSDRPSNQDSSPELMQLQLALEAAGMGTWSYDSQNQKIWLSVIAQSLMGYSNDDPIALAEFLKLIHADDRQRLSEALLGSDTRSLDLEFRLHTHQRRRLKGKAIPQAAPFVCTGIIEESPTIFLPTDSLSRLAFQNQEVGFCTVYVKTDAIDYSPSYAWIMTGNAEARLTRFAFVESIHPEDELLRQAAFSTVTQTGQLSYEPRVVWQDGSIHRIRVTATCHFDADGKPEQFNIIATGIRESSLERAFSDTYQRFQTLITASPIAMGLISGEEMIVETANAALFQLLGKGREIIGKPGLTTLADWTDHPFLQDLQRVHQTHQPYTSPEISVHQQYYQFHYTPIRTETNEKTTLVVAVDITREVQNRLQLESSQRQLLSYFEQSPVAIAIIKGPDLTLEMANSFYGELVGRAPEEIIGKPMLEALPELAGQGFDQLLREVMHSGVPFVAYEMAATLLRNGVLDTIYVDLTYQPQYELHPDTHQKTITGILIVATHVTEQVKARKIVEASEARLRSILATSPAAMALFVGPEYLIDLPNQAFIDRIGQGPDIAGKPILDVLPEGRDPSTLRSLELVYETGVMQQIFGAQVSSVKHGVMTHQYYNSSYAPLKDENDQIYAVLYMAIDVTEVILQRQNALEAQATLLGAVELAELGTWEIDFRTQQITFSSRLRQWYGFSEDEILTPEATFFAVKEGDAPRLEQTFEAAFYAGGSYDVEFTLKPDRTGVERSLHAQGKIFYDSEEKPYKISGTTRDVTKQRKIQLALELQVQERTEELAAANEELLNINTKLAESNGHLMRSNESLEQFAYIASHDLQEPLRKIQQFGDLLKKNFQSSAQQELLYLNRMQDAASRMSMLIYDLLTFSRISSDTLTLRTTSLNEIIDQARENLSVVIEESKARIELDTLPIIQGDASQLRQLFQNLLSNALKFSKRDLLGNPTIPEIRIRYHKLKAIEVPSGVKPLVQAFYYHRIDLEDNGIGFDEQYLDRIFQVFQRLHGRNEFAGTGVGLAICQNVVNNHGGAITARSQPGQGSVFTVYFPVY